MGELATTAIIISTGGLSKETMQKLLRAAGELMERQTQFTLSKQELRKGVVMQINNTDTALPPFRCLTPESALDTVERILKAWPRG